MHPTRLPGTHLLPSHSSLNALFRAWRSKGYRAPTPPQSAGTNCQARWPVVHSSMPVIDLGPCPTDASAFFRVRARYQAGQRCRMRFARTLRRVREGLLPGPGQWRPRRAAGDRRPVPEGSVIVLRIGGTQARSLVSIPPNDRSSAASACRLSIKVLRAD